MDYFSGEDKDVHTPEDLIEVATNAGMTNEEVLLVFCSLYVAMHHCRPHFDLQGQGTLLWIQQRLHTADRRNLLLARGTPNAL